MALANSTGGAGTGVGNKAIGTNAFVGGGANNTASNSWAVIGGGLWNTASGVVATIGGGSFNAANGSGTTIGGGTDNTASNHCATIGGGYQNTALTNYATIGGGWLNYAAGPIATIGGGNRNTNMGINATIGGGYANYVSGSFGNIFVGGDYATIGGGDSNVATGFTATIAGGANNVAKGKYATIGGGNRNTNGGTNATIGGGLKNTTGANYATVPGGVRAMARHEGSFVWSGVNKVTTTSTNKFSFTARAPGGVRFITATNNGLTGVIVQPNATAWSVLSDRESKTDFQPIEPRKVLSKLAAMPVTSWQYKHDPSRRYIGPTSQDFMSAFRLGNDAKGINTLDADGVTFAAIKGLVEELKERDKTIEELKAKSDKSDRRNSELSREIEAIKERLNALPPAP
jgi:hypothetical protein